jgi:hypothetical protein
MADRGNGLAIYCYNLSQRLGFFLYLAFIMIRQGIIFQYYGNIFVASYQTKNIVCDGQTYSFKNFKANQSENHFRQDWDDDRKFS